MLSNIQYATRYKQWNNLRAKMAAEVSAGKSKFTIEQGRTYLLNKAKELGLTVSRDGTVAFSPQDTKPGTSNINQAIDPKILKSIMSNPNISEHDKNIWQRDLDRKVPRGCYSFQNEYRPPPGTEAFERFKNFTDCGNSCICVDKGADRNSIDRINLSKNFDINWVCDGEHHDKDPENISIGQGVPPLKPILRLNYKGTNRDKLFSTMKPLCKTVADNIWVEDKYNICRNDKVPTINKSKLTLSISGNQRNSKQFWEAMANAIGSIDTNVSAHKRKKN